MMPIPIGGGQTVGFGLAGGSLLVALVLGRLERTGGISWAMPLPANLTIRQIGLLLFLAGVGTGPAIPSSRPCATTVGTAARRGRRDLRRHARARSSQDGSSSASGSTRCWVSRQACRRSRRAWRMPTHSPAPEVPSASYACGLSNGDDRKDPGGATAPGLTSVRTVSHSIEDGACGCPLTRLPPGAFRADRRNANGQRRTNQSGPQDLQRARGSRFSARRSFFHRA